MIPANNDVNAAEIEVSFQSFERSQGVRKAISTPSTNPWAMAVIIKKKTVDESFIPEESDFIDESVVWVINGKGLIKATNAGIAGMTPANKGLIDQAKGAIAAPVPPPTTKQISRLPNAPARLAEEEVVNSSVSTETSNKVEEIPCITLQTAKE